MLKFPFFLILLALPLALKAQLNVDLVAHIDYEAEGNDIWGWTAPDGTEYALVGLTTGISFVQIGDAVTTREVTFLPGDFSLWRDLKTFGNYCYVVADQSTSREGLHIIDLSALPGQGKVTESNWYPVTAPGDTLLKAHNLYIDENGIAYLAGSNLNGGGILLLDVAANPTQPPVIGAGPREYAHDVYAAAGKMYASELNRGQLAIYDVSNPGNMRLLATQPTPFRFTHNAWPTADGRFVFTTDERSNAPVAAFDITNLDNVRQLDLFRPAATLGRGVIPHNVHVQDNWLVISYYSDGVVIVDASRPENLVEVGNYDTYPINQVGYHGAWGAYPFLPSGRLLVSDIESGLFVLEPRYVRAAYLEGKITDAGTGLPVPNTEIRLVAGQPNSDFSDNQGNYRTGLAANGTYEVIVRHPEYFPETTTATLRNGEVTRLDIALRQLSAYTVSGQAVSGQAAVAGASILLKNDNFQYETTAGPDGRFLLNDVFEGKYEVIAGAWGFRHRQLLEVEIRDNSFLTITLDQGYQDDFIFDLGWQTLSNASAGNWVRGLPDGVIHRSQYSTPPADISGDYGNAAFLTDNGGGSGLSHDVDNGTVTLLSPPMDLTPFEAPVLTYHRWFHNAEQSGSGPPDDVFTVWITNGQDTVLLEKIETSGSEWSPSPEFMLREWITITDRMQVIFQTSDLPGSPHVVEAAVDAFLVIDGNLTPTRQPAAPPLEMTAFPNPFTDHLTIRYRLPPHPGQAFLTVFNSAGQRLFTLPVEQTNGEIPLGANLPTGVYWIQLSGSGIAPKTVKVVKY